ncbi:unnamed protein product [Mesocestoides corti]|uniref:Uncharacterized protein n=1 Tax=Mesocestoides corti TaxID=53468 RepID=A0A0R3UCG8_MESCO|nr:unnamed protein product [Mesocestoides corti]
MEPEEFIDNNYAAESEEEEEVEESEPSEHVDEEASHSPVDNRQCDDQQLRFVLLEFALKFYPELAECISKCVSNEECAVVEPEEQNYSPPFDDKPMEPEEFIDNNYAAESEEEEEEEEEEGSESSIPVDEEASHSPVDNRQCDDQQLHCALFEFAQKFYPAVAECISQSAPIAACRVVEPEEQNYSPPFDDKPMEPEEFIDNNYAAESEEEEEEGECEERCKCDRMQLLQFLADFFRDAYPEMADCIPKCVPRDVCPAESCTDKDECNVEPEEHNYSPPINDKCEKPEDFIDNNYAAESEEEEEEEEESEPCGCVVDDHADHAGHRLDCVTMEKLILLLLFTRHVYPEITDGIRRSVCHCKR